MNRKNKTLIQQKENVEKLILWGLALIFIILPLAVHSTNLYHVSPIISGTGLDTGNYRESFATFQLFLLIGSTICLLTLFLYKTKLAPITSDPLNYVFYILIMLIMLSTMFSPYKSISIFGHFALRQGSLTYLMYLLLFFISTKLAYSPKSIRILLQSLYPYVIVNTLLNLSSFYGLDYFRLQSTMGNPDYLSGFSSVLAILFLAYALFEENKLQRGINLIFAVLSSLLVLSSMATSGFVTMIICIPLIAALLQRHPRKFKAVATLSVFLFCFITSFVVLNAHNQTVWQESIGFLFKPQTTVQTTVQDLSSKSAMQTNDNLNDELYLPPDGSSPGNGRLYIWKKTIDLIKARPITGYGLDTLAFIFPQFDLDKKAELSDQVNVIVDKPHNMYLGIAFGCGIAALLFFVVMVLVHILRHIRVVWSCKGLTSLQMNASLLAAVVAYLIQALVNDPVIGSAAVFWILFGVSASLVKANNSEFSVSG